MAKRVYIFLILILNMSLLCKAIDKDRKVHIVYLESLPDDEVYSYMSHHLGILERVRCWEKLCCKVLDYKLQKKFQWICCRAH
ncbi:hypothetical protein RchiOBHm_Chr1g0323321 [Rosa chinensis]|uniref:Uncharacterized protein n=1 Tax=Rosa chinensis TaxID=74649 RepID=A0A2P6S9F5_ROSCH|nr:hypothetical protein RchiOBHm_Chr1g0323321 [Rosa chinensis]